MSSGLDFSHSCEIEPVLENIPLSDLSKAIVTVARGSALINGLQEVLKAQGARAMALNSCVDSLSQSPTAAVVRRANELLSIKQRGIEQVCDNPNVASGRPADWSPDEVGMWTFLFGSSATRTQLSQCKVDSLLQDLSEAKTLAEKDYDHSKAEFDYLCSTLSEAERTLFRRLKTRHPQSARLRADTREAILAIVKSTEAAAAESALALGLVYFHIEGNMSNVESIFPWGNSDDQHSGISQWEYLDMRARDTPSDNIMWAIKAGGSAVHTLIETNMQLCTCSSTSQAQKYEAVDALREVLCLPASLINPTQRSMAQRSLLLAERIFGKKNHPSVPELICPPVVQVLLYAIRFSQIAVEETLNSLGRCGLHSDPLKASARRNFMRLAELARGGNPAAFKELAKIVDDKNTDWQTRQLMATQMCRLLETNGMEAGKRVIYFLRDEHPVVRRSVEEALIDTLSESTFDQNLARDMGMYARIFFSQGTTLKSQNIETWEHIREQARAKQEESALRLKLSGCGSSKSTGKA